MIDLKNRIIYEDGTVICNESAAIDMLYQGQDLTGVILDNIELANEFNNSNKYLDQEFEFLNSGNGPQYQNIDWYSMWLTPEEYQSIDVLEYCLKRCTRDQQKNRVTLEFKMFTERNMIPILRHLIWMVDHMRKNKIVWGCGRGSMTASYLLFIIGIHRIDSIKYNLDIKEFLR